METISLTKAQKSNKVKASAAEGTTKPSKVGKETSTDEKNTKAVKEKIAKEKDVMYQYPADATDGPAKKKFRAAARRQKAAFIRDIKNEKDAEKQAKLIKKANKWSKETYSPEHMVAFE